MHSAMIAITDTIFSLTFVGWVVMFNLGFLCGCIFAAFRRIDELEGVGQGLACTRNERAAVQAGPGGGQ